MKKCATLLLLLGVLTSDVHANGGLVKQRLGQMKRKALVQTDAYAESDNVM